MIKWLFQPTACIRQKYLDISFFFFFLVSKHDSDSIYMFNLKASDLIECDMQYS